MLMNDNCLRTSKYLYDTARPGSGQVKKLLINYTDRIGGLYLADYCAMIAYAKLSMDIPHRICRRGENIVYHIFGDSGFLDEVTAGIVQINIKSSLQSFGNIVFEALAQFIVNVIIAPGGIEVTT